MKTVTDDQFYSALHLHDMPLDRLLIDQQHFTAIPENWHVVITDITGSTKAVGSGRHQEVNLIATGSIVTVLNIAFKMKVTVPFFFGGDGATFIIPGIMIDKVMNALTVYKANTLANFGLDLRAGTVTIDEIYGNGHRIDVAKFSSSKNFAIPIVLGNGLNYAEQIIKGEGYLFATVATAEEPDLNGMMCRWDEIPAPANKEEIVTLLIIAVNTGEQPEIFSRILSKMDEIYGTPDKRQPISIPKLHLRTSFNNLGREMRAQIGKIRLGQLIKT